MNAVKYGRAGGDRLIRVSMTVVVLAVAAVAAWVSYRHAVAVIERYGAEDELSAHLVPATVDGMIYASSMVLLWCARYRLPVPMLARWALALGVAATLAANILHGIEKGALAAALAAWPAIALVVSYELFMWVVRSGREVADRFRRDPVPADSDEPAVAPAVAPSVVPAVVPAETRTMTFARSAPPPDVRGPGIRVPEVRVPENAMVAEDAEDDEGQTGESLMDGDRRARAAALLAQDPNMSGAALARALGVHETTGRKYRREALNGNGYPA